MLGAPEQGAESDFSLKGSKYLPQARSDSVVCGRIGLERLQSRNSDRIMKTWQIVMVEDQAAVRVTGRRFQRDQFGQAGR